VSRAAQQQGRDVPVPSCLAERGAGIGGGQGHRTLPPWPWPAVHSSPKQSAGQASTLHEPVEGQRLGCTLGHSRGLTCNIARFNGNEICASIFTCFSLGTESKQRACAACVILGTAMSRCGFACTSKLNVPGLTPAPKPGGR